MSFFMVFKIINDNNGFEEKVNKRPSISIGKSDDSDLDEPNLPNVERPIDTVN